MADWVICPSCQLKQSLRPDGICPRCKNSVHAAPSPGTGLAPTDPQPAPPLQPTSSPAPGSASQGVASKGVRIAGAVLVINGILVLIEKFAVPSLGSTSAFSTPVSSVIDLLVGGALLAGRDKYRGLAMLRVGLGALIFTGIHVAGGNALEAVLQLVFSGSLLLLLLGNASSPRIVGALVGVSTCFALEVIGLYTIKSGHAPLAALLRSGQLDAIPETGVDGDRLPYHLQSPGPSWKLRKSDAARKDNAMADRWLTDPARDAHLIVIAEEVPNVRSIDIQKLGSVVLDNARKASSDLTVLESSPLTWSQGSAMSMHTTALMKGLEIEFLYGVFARDNRAYQLVAFAPKTAFPELQADLTQAISSFRESR